MSNKNKILEMYGPENFQRSGHALIDLLTQYLEKNLAGESKVIAWKAPVTEDANWQAALPKNATLSADAFIQKLDDDILANTLAIHHPRNMGHQVANPLPMAALCDLVAALTNQAMTIYEAGPSATMLERQVIRWLCELISPSWKRLEASLPQAAHRPISLRFWWLGKCRIRAMPIFGKMAFRPHPSFVF